MAKKQTDSILLAFTGLSIDGGIAVVSRCIARILDGRVASGHLGRVDRLLFLDEADQAPPPPANGEQALAHGSKLGFVSRLWSIAIRHRPDLILYDLVGIARSSRLPLPGLRSRPYVVFAHGIELIGIEETASGEALRGAWRVLANSEFTGNSLRAQFPEIADRIRVTPLCIDPERVRLWESMEDGNRPDRVPAALIVGRMWSEEQGKGHDALIDVWRDVETAVPGAELWIVGGGDDTPRLEQKAREAGVSARFLGRISDQELFDRYREASVFAMPSKQEGFGIVYAEAMWHGLPAIGSTADAAPFVIKDRETGVLVEYNDLEQIKTALIDILSDSAYRDRLGAAAAQHARTAFSFERFERDIIAALELTGD